ncbi:hypothetical protein [Geminocystis herdmanii]|uniref:hypothetical protein n=1 Tax=Geminocystis herdmanii TaxID=669359 RepID=UPI0003481439|nr:hypothetical protein [Geminocystis herdmanii]
METTITVTFSDEGKLELPSEISQIFSDGEQYSVITKDDTVIFQKVPKFDWDDWEKRLDEAGDDPDKMTIEEICEIVREVRREMKK